MTLTVAGSDATAPTPNVRFGTAQGRWVLTAVVLASGLAGIDASAVNITLPAIGRDFHVGFAALQWTVNAYGVTLAALILLGGAIGDQYGRRRVMEVGCIWFAAASLLCAVAPTAPLLIGARALQGVGAALVVPASLAIIQASFAPDDRGRAVGAWAGFAGVATAIAPFLGGWLVEAVGWRWVFLINPPLAVGVVSICRRHVPETRDPAARGASDLRGAVLCVIGLAGITYATIAAPTAGAALPVVAAAVTGVAALLLLMPAERRVTSPMLPLRIFRSRQFSAANVVTFIIYAAFNGSLFLLVVELQVVGGFSPVLAGAALLPITLLMLMFAARSGRLASRIGPRLQMSVGPLVVGAALLLLARLPSHPSYLAEILPILAVYGVGLVVLVAPLTAAVMAAAPAESSGIASGVNNAIARTAGLVAVAALPALTGITGQTYAEPARYLHAFHVAMFICAGLTVVGGAVAAATVRAQPRLPVFERQRPARQADNTPNTALVMACCPGGSASTTGSDAVR